MLTMFFIESSWELRMDILMGMIMVALPLICFPIFNKMYEHKEAIKQRLKEEKNKKLLEAQQYLNQLSGNIKTLLIESLQEEWGDIESLLTSDSDQWRIFEYAKEKMEYNNTKEVLMRKIQNDLTSSDIWAQDILEVHDSLLLYSKSLESLTQAYIKSMPIDMNIALKIHNLSLFQKVLNEENIWVENEAKEMQWTLNTWIHHHLKEVAKKKLELKELLNKEHQALWDLIGVTHTMRQHAFFQVQTRIS